MGKVVVTSYCDPDLDGLACAVAYAEFLNKTGAPAVIRLFGEPHIEARYVLQRFGFTFEQDLAASLERVILVDASELRDVEDLPLKSENIIEVIDHRRSHDAVSFTNAKIQIELVGAAATLIAEKFYQQRVGISVMATTLLYGGIISNTINLKNQITTDRDRQMAEWLKQGLDIPSDFINGMFRAKSDLAGDKLAARIYSDYSWFQNGHNRIGFAQLEVMDVKVLLNERQAELLDILKDLQIKDNLDYILISLVDLSGDFTAFLAAAPEMQSVLSDILGIKFENNLAWRPGIIMRKEIAPSLKEKFL